MLGQFHISRAIAGARNTFFGDMAAAINVTGESN
jgi:hypothetical protein